MVKGADNSQKLAASLKQHDSYKYILIWLRDSCNQDTWTSTQILECLLKTEADEIERTV